MTSNGLRRCIRLGPQEIGYVMPFSLSRNVIIRETQEQDRTEENGSEQNKEEEKRRKEEIREEKRRGEKRRGEKRRDEKRREEKRRGETRREDKRKEKRRICSVPLIVGQLAQSAATLLSESKAVDSIPTTGKCLYDEREDF
ncbi:jg4554 [Pararge aegeria aegeria]|uniref:Jg4554 protein n=1 Tax=Pararge aegeria aegeria TaxID=348720 RepID=A0A8S4RRV2_9NEOP|nr:jg4554 [Pararge aegeria aegeria]